jgi:hypothetical protein
MARRQGIYADVHVEVLGDVSLDRVHAGRAHSPSGRHLGCVSCRSHRDRDEIMNVVHDADA